MAYKQSPGRMNMPKTGGGVPSALTMPEPDPKKPKAAKDVKGFDEQFETVKAKYPKSVVTKRKGKLGSYTVITGTGSFGYTPGKPVD
jgi:hypothetical protein